MKLPRLRAGRARHRVLPTDGRLVREVHAGSSYLSSEDPRIHFGLGAATTVKRARPSATATARRHGSTTCRSTGSLTVAPRYASDPSWTCRRRTTVSNVTASSRIAPVTMKIDPGRVAEDEHAVRDGRDHRRADQRVADLAAAAEEARAADHRGGDRVDQQRAAAGVQVDAVQAGGEHDAAEARTSRPRS